MWCVPKLNEEFIARMENLLELYRRPYNPLEPVICFDEKSKQLLDDTRPTQPAKPKKTKRRDYNYKRNGTRNIFLTVEPKGGYRSVQATSRRTKKDFAKEIKRILSLPKYSRINKIHLVLDNLNTHFEKSFYETFSKTETNSILKKIKFHYTPKHASWLNMAEIEIGVMERQCLHRRIPDAKKLSGELKAWEDYRNQLKARINWKFTIKDAQNVFKEYYVTKLSG